MKCGEEKFSLAHDMPSIISRAAILCELLACAMYSHVARIAVGSAATAGRCAP
jgi:hypothetical protein